MADPITIGVAVITGLVGAYKAYAEYKATVVKAQAEQAAPPAKTAEAAKGEQVAQVVETGIQKYGWPEEQTALAGYQQSPQLFETVLAKVLADVAAREPDFAGQLQRVAQHAQIQTGGVQGIVNNSGTIRGAAVGVNTGTISGTYSDNESKQ